MNKYILKFFAVLLALAMLFVLAFCVKDEEDSGHISETADTSPVVTAGDNEKEQADDTDTDNKQTTDKPSDMPTASETTEPTDKAVSGKNGTGKKDDAAADGNQEETLPTTEPEEKDNEGELVEIELPIIDRLGEN